MRGLLDMESGSSCRVLGTGGVRNSRPGDLAGGFVSQKHDSARARPLVRLVGVDMPNEQSPLPLQLGGFAVCGHSTDSVVSARTVPRIRPPPMT